MLAFLLPILPKQAPIFIGLTLFFSLVYSVSKSKINSLYFKSTPNIILVIFFGTCLLSLLYSSNLSHGLKEIEIKLSFLVFPIIALTLPKSKDFKPFNILKSFAFSCAILLTTSLLYSLFHQASIYYQHQELYWGYYFGDYLVHTLHKGYFGIYMLISSLIFLYFGGVSKNKRSRRLYFCLSFLTLLGVYLSTAKGALLSSAVSYSIVGVFIFKRYFNIKKLLVTSSLIIGLAVTAILLLNNETTNRIRSSFSTLISFKKIDKKDEGSTNLRLMAWHSSTKLLKENFLIGCGIGDADEKLNSKYSELGYFPAHKRGLDSHNQFLATGIQTGIIGLITLLCLFIVSFVWSLKRNDLLSALFILTFFIFSLIESSLETQAGIIIFCLIIFTKTTKNAIN